MKQHIIQMHLLLQALIEAQPGVSPLLSPLHQLVIEIVRSERNTALFNYSNSGVSHRRYLQVIRYFGV